MRHAKNYLYDLYGFLMIYSTLVTVNKMTKVLNTEVLLTTYFVFTHFFNQGGSAHTQLIGCSCYNPILLFQCL